MIFSIGFANCWFYQFLKLEIINILLNSNHWWCFQSVLTIAGFVNCQKGEIIYMLLNINSDTFFGKSSLKTKTWDSVIQKSLHCIFVVLWLQKKSWPRHGTFMLEALSFKHFPTKKKKDKLLIQFTKTG